MKHILTDLGGVVVDLYWIEFAQKVLGKHYELDELIQMWHKCKSTNEYETGKQKNFDEFIRQYLIECNINISHNEMKHYFLDIIGAPKKRFFEIFEGFKRKGYILSVLSNTNPAHVNFLDRKYDLFRLFDYKFFSHETGYLKPHKEAYECAIKKLNASPSDIFFFDDARINIKAAISVGLNAFQVTSPQEIYDVIKISNNKIKY